MDSEIFIELVGLQDIHKINDLKLTIGRTIDFNNAVALFHNGARMIILDPQWAKSSTAEYYLVLGHEAGHHFCGHTIGSSERSPQESELEADRFSVASIKRFKVYHDKKFLDEALKAANRLYSASGSRSHPPRAVRVEAIMLGYKAGSPEPTLTKTLPNVPKVKQNMSGRPASLSFGAVAWGLVAGQPSTFTAKDAADPSSAGRAALVRCQKEASSCRVLTAFGSTHEPARGRCVAIAGEAELFLAIDESDSTASSRALEQCSEKIANCRLRYAVCNLN